MILIPWLIRDCFVPSDAVMTSSASLSSMGYNLVMGLLVVPFKVRIVAAHISPSPPTIKSSMTAIFHVALAVS